MSSPADLTLSLLREELELANADASDYVLFGSAVLYLHGLRETIGDVDVLVSRGIWAEFFTADWRLHSPRADDPPFLEVPTMGVHRVPIHAFYDWTSRDADWFRANECWEQAEAFDHPTLGRWRCIPLSLIRAHKVGAHAANPRSDRHAKHLSDVEAIDAHLEKSPA